MKASSEKKDIASSPKMLRDTAGKKKEKRKKQ